ncbi:MAG: SNF2-related protein [Magnetococcus sp. YQC-3]
MKKYFEYESTADGILIRLVTKRLLGDRRMVPFAHWSDESPTSSMAGIGAIARLLTEQNPATPVERHPDGLLLSHPAVASLTEAQAMDLGLPPNTSLMLCVQSKGDMAQKEFDISCHWGESGRARALGAEVFGSLIRFRGVFQRIPEPLFTLHAAIRAFRESDTTDDATRFRHFATIREIAPQTSRNWEIDPYIQNTRIHVASSFSLKFSHSPNGFELDPLLFGRTISQAWDNSEGTASIGEAESLLPDAGQERFSQAFRGWSTCRDRYALGNSDYVYIEPELREALGVVRTIQCADSSSQWAFARHPQTHLKSALKDRVSDSAIERLFIATDEYSQRVQELAIWQPMVLPWVQPFPNSWLPESFGILVGEQRIILKPEELDTVCRELDEAEARGETYIKFHDDIIPVSEETRKALDELRVIRPDGSAPIGNTNASPNPNRDSRFLFLTVKENVESTTFAPLPKPRASFRFGVLPISLRSPLKPHQEEGLRWLAECWCTGHLGCLLADDMGLGKTLQALAFLVWLQEARQQLGFKRRPMLIVAPVGLLDNWREEAERHFTEQPLGEPLRVYAPHLDTLRTGQGTDTRQGVSMLSTDRLADADWVLTSYDTLRDYHISFAKIKWAAVLYDEAQKLKNPGTQCSIAAKTVNAGFSVALSGTPIENRMEDLWGIMDIVYPGYLPDSIHFSDRYAMGDEESLRELQSAMLDPPPNRAGPPVMLRRMKADQLRGLPEKYEHPIERTMPVRQADAYHVAVTTGKRASSPGAVLHTLNSLRSISLHPLDPRQAWNNDGGDYVEQSARLSVTFKELEKIASKREKVLIFLEDLDMQEWLAAAIKQRFKLNKQPLIIHGGVPGDRRKVLVDEFQKGQHNDGFDVMILSPRAGGVGLTLTAANHVIHLSRWWNPAVEDQCTDRVYRIGQRRTVHVYHPLAVHPDFKEYSFDLRLRHLLDRKRRMSRDVLIPPLLPEDEESLFQETVQGKTASSHSPSVSQESLSLAEVDRMTPRQFEEWVLRCLSDQGWHSHRTPFTRDGGADGILEDSQGRQVIVQVKHRTGPGNCDVAPVDELLRARREYALPDARLLSVTNAKGYTSSAVDRAVRHSVELVARDRLMRFLESG